jgi:hypothetical protein
MGDGRSELTEKCSKKLFSSTVAIYEVTIAPAYSAKGFERDGKLG